MGEYLVIWADLGGAAELLKFIGKPSDLYWEIGWHQREVLTRWLPKKGFKILPKLFDPNYNPGTVNDDADELITRVQACYWSNPRGREDPIPVWKSKILEQTQTRAELRRVIEEDVLDMSFEEEVMEDVVKTHPNVHYPVNEQSLENSREHLKDLARILMKLANGIDRVKQEGEVPYVEFEFYIPRG